MTIDRQAAARAIRDFLCAIGRDPAHDPELTLTPERVTEAFADDLLGGYAVDVPRLLAEAAPLRDAGGGLVAPGPVIVHDIAVTTVCPHHLMPSLGAASVGYVPGDRICGLGTLAALVDAFARRLSLQEQIGANVVRALVEHAGAKGAVCRLKLRHACLSARGQRQAAASVETIASFGDVSALGALTGGAGGSPA